MPMTLVIKKMTGTFVTIRLLSVALFCVAQGSSGTMPVQTLTLRQAQEIALRNNRQIGIARLQVDQVGQRIAEARTSLLPQLNVLAQGGYLLDTLSARFPKGILGTVNGSPVPSQDIDITTGNRFTAIYDLSLAQPLTQIPRIRIGIRLQELGRDLAQEQERQQRQTIASNVRQAYFGLLQTQEAVKATNANLQALHELERTVTNQVVQQAALRADLLDVQARAAAQEASLATQLDTLAQYKEQMNILLGRNVQTPFQVAPETEPVPVDSDRDSLQAQAAQNRPDLRRSALQIRQAELDRRNSELSFLPDVSLAMNYAALGGGVNGLPDHLWTIGFQLSWQPFEWGRRRHEIAEKTDAIAQARLAQQEAQAGAQLDVDNRIRQERQAREQRRAAQAAQTAARERLRVTLNQFQVKAALLKDVLQAQAALTDADRQVRDADLAALTAQAELRRALGEE
jgi:outer membrane protein